MARWHPQIGVVEEDDPPLKPKKKKYVDMIWDEEQQRPVAPPPQLPPLSVRDAAEEAEPSVSTALRRLGAAVLRKMARRLDR